jgi:hypothetical protein
MCGTGRTLAERTPGLLRQVGGVDPDLWSFERARDAGERGLEGDGRGG